MAWISQSIECVVGNSLPVRGRFAHCLPHQRNRQHRLHDPSLRRLLRARLGQAKDERSSDPEAPGQCGSAAVHAARVHWSDRAYCHHLNSFPSTDHIAFFGMRFTAHFMPWKIWDLAFNSQLIVPDVVWWNLRCLFLTGYWCFINLCKVCNIEFFLFSFQTRNWQKASALCWQFNLRMSISAFSGTCFWEKHCPHAKHQLSVGDGVLVDTDSYGEWLNIVDKVNMAWYWRGTQAMRISHWWLPLWAFPAPRFFGNFPCEERCSGVVFGGWQNSSCLWGIWVTGPRSRTCISSRQLEGPS